MAMCKTDGCNRPVKYIKPQLCSACYQRLYYYANREKLKAWQREYNKNHPKKRPTIKHSDGIVRTTTPKTRFCAKDFAVGLPPEKIIRLFDAPDGYQWSKHLVGRRS